MKTVKRAVLPIPRQSLRRLLQLDDTYDIEAVYYDIHRETLVLVLSNDSFPETPEGERLPELVVQATEKHGEDGKIWVHLEPTGVRTYEASSSH